jgi:hemoglobin
LYDEIGGASTVALAVEDLYRRVLSDPELAPMFEGVDFHRLKAHQRQFLAAAIGGAQLYAGRDMVTAHANLPITSSQFDAVVIHLVDTLADLGVPDDIIAGIGATLAPLRGQIVRTAHQLAG